MCLQIAQCRQQIYTRKTKLSKNLICLYAKLTQTDYLRVHVSERDKDGVWRDTSGCDTARFFKQDERSIASIDKKVFSYSLDLLSISMQAYQMMQLTYLSSDTKEWLRELSTKTTNISNELCRLKEQIKEEHYNDIQDTEN